MEIKGISFKTKNKQGRVFRTFIEMRPDKIVFFSQMTLIDKDEEDWENWELVRIFGRKKLIQKYMGFENGSFMKVMQSFIRLSDAWDKENSLKS
jgi:hypothetical protein